MYRPNNTGARTHNRNIKLQYRDRLLQMAGGIQGIELRMAEEGTPGIGLEHINIDATYSILGFYF